MADAVLYGQTGGASVTYKNASQQMVWKYGSPSFIGNAHKNGSTYFSDGKVLFREGRYSAGERMSYYDPYGVITLLRIGTTNMTDSSAATDGNDCAISFSGASSIYGGITYEKSVLKIDGNGTVTSLTNTEYAVDTAVGNGNGAVYAMNPGSSSLEKYDSNGVKTRINFNIGYFYNECCTAENNDGKSIFAGGVYKASSAENNRSQNKAMWIDANDTVTTLTANTNYITGIKGVLDSSGNVIFIKQANVVEVYDSNGVHSVANISGLYSADANIGFSVNDRENNIWISTPSGYNREQKIYKLNANWSTTVVSNSLVEHSKTAACKMKHSGFILIGGNAGDSSGTATTSEYYAYPLYDIYIPKGCSYTVNDGATVIPTSDVRFTLSHGDVLKVNYQKSSIEFQ